MGQTKERIQSWVLFLGDMVCIIAAYYIAGHLWLQGFKGYSLGETMNLLSNNILTIFVAGMLTSLFYSNASEFTSRGFFIEFREIIKKSILLAGFIAVYELMRRDGSAFPRGVFVLTVVLTVLLAMIMRFILKKYLTSYDNQNVILRMVMVTTKECLLNKPY